MKTKDLVNRVRQNKLFADSFWALFGNVMSKGLSLLAAILVARFLGKEAYGEYGMIKNTLVYIAVFSTFGLGFTATKFVSQYKDVAPERLRSLINSAVLISLAFSGLMALLVLVFARPLAVYLEDPSLTTTLRYTSVVILFNSLASVQIGILAGLKKFRETAKINIEVGVITFIFSVVLTYYYALNGAVIALLITNVANCLLNAILLKSSLTSDIGGSRLLLGDLKSLVKFSAPIALQESSYSVTFWASNLILVKMADYGQLGLHSAATQWTAIILFIPSVLQNVMLSYLSESASLDKSSNQHAMLKHMLMINFTATFIPFLRVWSISPFIVSIYGDSYFDLPLVLNVAMAATIIRCMVQVFIQEFIALGKTWTLCGIRLSRDVLSLILTAVLIMHLKDNAAFLYNLSFLIASLLCLILLWTIYNKTYNNKLQNAL